MQKKIIYIIILFILLATIAESQRGRGSRGGSSFGGSSSRSRFYGGSGYYGYHRGTSFVGWIIGLICLIPITCAVLCIMCGTCGGRCCVPSDPEQRQSENKEDLNRPKQNYTPQDEIDLERIKSIIVDAINSSGQLQNFTYTQNNQTNLIRARVNEVNRVGPMVYQIGLAGDDELGPWTAQGTIINHEEYGPKMRYYKVYADRDYAGQTDSYYTLIYDSTSISQTNIQGKWFFLGHQNEESSNGTWRITYSGSTWNNHNGGMNTGGDTWNSNNYNMGEPNNNNNYYGGGNWNNNQNLPF